VQARFDEQNNIEATRAMQEAGIKVIPGVPGLKVHSKLILISRKEGTKSNRYVHVGSGNFNEKTSEIYTDISLLTANKEIGQEVRKIFEFFESNFTRHIFRHLLVSPFNTRRKFVDLIHEEIDAAEKKKPAFITLKMNNLVDAGMIRKLYEASQAGVKVNLIIRGVCSLIPGVKGQSENIKVHTPIGRFLEHNRIAVFCNQGDPLYFISSADWMTRNLDHRVEVTTPIYQEDLKQELQNYLDITLKNIHSKDSKKIHPQMLAYEYFRSRKTTK
jgi:polyphosphate kinase